MGQKERTLINNTLLAGSETGRMFRANSGKAWQGKNVSLPRHILKMISSWLTSQGIKHREIKVLIDPRIFHGMVAGTPDTIGWESKTICEFIKEKNIQIPCQGNSNCVGCPLTCKIAIFKAVECKTGKQQLTEEQKHFKDVLEKQGGIYEIKR